MGNSGIVVRRKCSPLLLLALLSGCSFPIKYYQVRDLTRFERPVVQNDWFVCPPNLCLSSPNYETPVFPVTKDELIKRTKMVINRQHRTKLIGAATELEQLIFVQRSKFLGLPDTIWIQFVGLKEGTSLIIYSRSNYGYWDFGINGRRIKNWLEEIKNKG